jgi:predicted Zn-dependent protease
MIDAMAKTEEIIKKAKGLGADEVVASTVFGKYRQVSFSNNQIDITVAWNDYTTNVILAWKKRVVATQIHDFRESDASLKQLMKLVKVSEENPTFGGFAKGTFRYVKSRADKKIANPENLTDYVFAAIEAAKKEAGSKVESGGMLLVKFENVYLASSEGPSGVDTRSAIELSIRAFSEREASGHGVECTSMLRDFEPSRAGENTAAPGGLVPSYPAPLHARSGARGCPGVIAIRQNIKYIMGNCCFLNCVHFCRSQL